MTSDYQTGQGLALGCVAVILLSCVGLVGLGGYWLFAPSGARKPPATEGPAHASAGKDKQQAELEQRMRELAKKVAAVKAVLQDLDRDRQEVLSKLRQDGVASGADLKDKPAAQKYAARLQQIVQEADGLRRKLVEYEEAVDEAQAVLRRYERHLALKAAGVTDEELVEVTTMITRIDEKLKGTTNVEAVNPLKIDEVLETELKKPQPKSDPRSSVPPAAEDGPGVRSVAAALRELQVSDAQRRAKAAYWLSQQKLDPQRQDAVAKALDPHVTDTAWSVRLNTLQALETWAVPANVPTLVRLLGTEERAEVRKAALRVLGRLPDERSAEALAEALKDTSNATLAGNLLKKMGPVAEKAVRQRLQDENAGVRREAANILAVIGTRDSVDELKQLKDADPDAGTKGAAAKALQAIEGRTGK